MLLSLDNSTEKNNLKMLSFIQQIQSLNSLSLSLLPSLISDQLPFPDQAASGQEPIERQEVTNKK